MKPKYGTSTMKPLAEGPLPRHPKKPPKGDGSKRISPEPSRYASLYAGKVPSTGVDRRFGSAHDRQKPAQEHPIILRVELPRCPFFKPPANALEPYQLELLASVFSESWAEIVPRGCPLPHNEEERLQIKVSARLCSLAAKGLMDPGLLHAVTVATVFHHRTGRRRKSMGTRDPIAG
jgi:hypothetical protein